MSELPEKELDSGLRAAFDGSTPDNSVLKTLGAKPLHLPGADREPATDSTGRYQTVGEIARGGVGIIYKGRDIDLGRDVAIKVLRDEYKEDPSVAERFMEEAQIGGQLQHPGIVPVYELGLDEQRRPYFSMKLVKGKTLAARMGDGARRLLGIFEKVCETMAYAHARGVVHRDLKPANIMVGAFGEVQIVDWGFAKVLREGGIADEKARPDVSVIATVRSTGGGSESIAGSVMGTPAYMPPEQALGQVDALDERSDVFALGAILFEILTGRKLYEKKGNDNLIVVAAQCKLDEQLALLKGHELEPLVRHCLAARQSDRPKDAA
ncbi:MAG: serine/threonine-protein kinase, partial [Planctomycetota bacterium]